MSEEELSVLRFRQKWRTMASSVVVAIRSASRSNSNNMKSVDLEKIVETTFQMRRELRKGISSMENQLRGQTQELEALKHILQTRPCAGRRRKPKKRQRFNNDTNNDDSIPNTFSKDNGKNNLHHSTSENMILKK